MKNQICAFLDQWIILCNALIIEAEPIDQFRYLFCIISLFTLIVQIFNEANDSILSIDVNGHEILVGSADCNYRIYNIRDGTVWTFSFFLKYYNSDDDRLYGRERKLCTFYS